MIKRDDIEVCVARGAEICKKIKNQWFPNTPPKYAFGKVSNIFSVIKEIMREIRPYTNDDELLLHLLAYNEQDLQDVFDRKEEILCAELGNHSQSDTCKP